MEGGCNCKGEQHVLHHVAAYGLIKLGWISDVNSIAGVTCCSYGNFPQNFYLSDNFMLAG
jgi:hypothetical protein